VNCQSILSEPAGVAPYRASLQQSVGRQSDWHVSLYPRLNFLTTISSAIAIACSCEAAGMIRILWYKVRILPQAQITAQLSNKVG